MAQLQDSTPAEEVQTFDALLAADRTSTLGKSRLGKARKYIDRLALPPQAGSTGSFFLDGSLLPMNEASDRELGPEGIVLTVLAPLRNGCKIFSEDFLSTCSTSSK